MITNGGRGGGKSYDTIYQRMSLVCYHSVIYGRTVEFLGPVTHLPKNHSLIPFLWYFAILCLINTVPFLEII